MNVDMRSRQEHQFFGITAKMKWDKLCKMRSIYAKRNLEKAQ